MLKTDAKKLYEAPMLVAYGSVADRTYNTPGGVKGCTSNCHLDMFNENSANAAS